MDCKLHGMHAHAVVSVIIAVGRVKTARRRDPGRATHANADANYRGLLAHWLALPAR